MGEMRMSELVAVNTHWIEFIGSHTQKQHRSSRSSLSTKCHWKRGKIKRKEGDLSPPFLKLVVTIATTFQSGIYNFPSNSKFHNIAILRTTLQL